MSYAQKTKVPVERSIGEIQKVLNKAKASGFMFAQHGREAYVAFVFDKTAIKMRLKLPVPPSDGATNSSVQTYHQLCRQKWRALLLVIKAKLEAVESGIETLEQAFLANIVLKDGTLVGEKVIGKIQELNHTPAALLMNL